MKVKSAFNHPATGEKLMPGQAFDEEGFDKEELEDLKNRGYLADGDGTKPGEEVDLAKMSSADLKSYAQALGIDTGSLRDRRKLENAVKTKQQASAPPPAGPSKRATLTFGPGAEQPTVEEKDESPEDAKKHNETVAKARADHEKEIQQSGKGGGGGGGAGGASKSGGAKASGATETKPGGARGER